MKRLVFLFFYLCILIPTYGLNGIYSNTPIENISIQLNGFNYLWDASMQQFYITTLYNTKKIWSTLPNKAFLTAADASEVIDEVAGSFTIEEEIIDSFLVQSINSISQINQTIVVAGTLSNNSKSFNYTCVFKPIDNQIQFDIKILDALSNRIFLKYSSDSDEAIFGFGEQYSYFNHKGNNVPIIVNEQGIGRGDITDPIINAVLRNSKGNDYTTYKPVPQYITSKNRGLFLEGYDVSFFDCRQANAIEIKYFSNQLLGRIIVGANPKELITSYTQYTGRMPILPSWIQQGAVVGVQGGTDKIYKVWQTLKNADVPVAAFWIQDWVGQRTTLLGKQLWWNWELDTEHYTNYDSLFNDLKNNNIALMGYINPFLAEVLGNKDYFRRRLLKEAKDNDFLVKKQNGKPYEVQNSSFASGVLDLTNPNTQTWIKDIIKDELIARGFKGWMADFGEAMPYNTVIYDPLQNNSIHNQYPEIWAQLNKEAIEESGFKDEFVYFMRSAFTKSPGQCNLFWEGDQLVDWGKNDGIKSAVTGLLSSGMSGFSINHSDIGGYTSISYPVAKKYLRSKELLNRWMEMNAFTAVFRTHEGLNPDLNYQVYDDSATALHFAHYAKIYKALEFYRQQLIVEASNTGIPVNRPLFLEFPTDTNTHNISYQEFMLGSEFIIAPILDPNTTSKKIYLPQGSWTNLWNGNTIVSIGSYYIENSLEDKPAVYYKTGSTIALEFRNNLNNLGISVP